MIHIVFSESTAASVKYGIKGDKKIIALLDNLSQGPIGKELSWEMRKDWLITLSNDEDKDLIEDYIKESYDKFFRFINEIKNEDKICIWAANNSREQCGIRYVLSKINRYENVYTVNVSNLTFNEGEINEFTPRSAGEVIAEKLNIIYEKEEQPLSYEIFLDLIGDWNTLIKEHSQLRVFKKVKVLSIGGDFYDEIILKTTKKLSRGEYRKCARVIEEILGHSKDHICEDYIFWRIKELIKKGQLSYRGNQRSMRYLEIKG